MKTRQEKHQARVQKRQRREGAERSHFTQPITGKQARHISKAEAGLAYGETDRQIKGQIRASGEQQAKVGSWYDTFANEIAASRGEVAGAYDKANASIAGNMQTAAADNTARNADLAAQDAQFAQLTGGPQNTAGPQTDAAAQGQRELYGAALAAPVAAQGANAYAYLTNQKLNATGEGIHQKIQERKRRQSLQQDRKALLKEKGQYRATKLDELREREQGRADERWKVNKAFPLEQQAASADAANTAFDNGIAQQNANTAKQNANTSQYSAHHQEGEGEGKKIDGNHVRRAYGFLENYWQEPPKKNTLTGKVESPAGRKVMEGWSNSQMISQLMAKSEGITFSEAKRAVAKWRKRHPEVGGPVSADNANPHGR